MQFLLNNIYIAIFYMISIVALAATVNNSFYAGVLFLPILALGVYLLKYRNKFPSSVFTMKVWLLIQTLSTIIMLIMAYKLQVNFYWDWGKVIVTASNFVLTGEWDDLTYYARYPNNQFWLVILIYFFSAVKFIIPAADLTIFKVASVLFGCLLIQGTIFVIYRSAALIWGEKKALLVGVIVVACAPLYIYAQFTYTDLPALFLTAITCYLYLKNKSKEKAISFIILGLVAALVFQIKVLGFIVFIAVLMDYLITSKNLKNKIVNTVCFLIVFILTNVLISEFTERTVTIPEDYSEKYEFPSTHWIMMGLYGAGGYSDDDVAYSKSFSTRQEKVDASIARIKERVEEKGAAGLVEHVVKTKVVKTWADPTYYGSVFAGRNTVIKDGKFQKFFTQNGEWFWIFNIYASIYHIATLLGLLLVGILCRKQTFLFMKTALIGIVVFLSIWECTSRYLLSFLPIIILLSCQGWFTLMKRYKYL